MSIPDCKSVQVVDCKLSDEHSPSLSVCQTNPSAPNEEPGLHPSVSASIPSLTKIHKSFTLDGTASSKMKPLKIPPKRLALCGGGIRCIAHIGVFKALQHYNQLKGVKEVLGISGGALFGLLFVLGYTLEQAERLALELDFTVLRDIDPENIFSFPFTYGLDSGAGLEKLLKTLLIRKGFSEDITFEDLSKQSPIHFRCYATNIEECSIHEFSLEKTPSCSVKFAVRASMSLPVLYTPMKEPSSGKLLMDGGILHNLPLVFQKEEEQKETLAVLFSKNTRLTEVNMLNIFQAVYDSITIMRNEPFLEKHKERILLIPVRDTNAINFELNKEQKKELIQLAFDTTKQFLFQSSQKPIRRFSV